MSAPAPGSCSCSGGTTRTRCSCRRRKPKNRCWNPSSARAEYPNNGQRVVAGQRLMQAASDIFLGWDRVTGIDGQARDFYIRQLRDWKGSADVDTMTASAMTFYARICAATLARAHARSGDRIAIASYLGNSDAFDRAIADFSSAYADQNERDYQALVKPWTQAGSSHRPACKDSTNQ